MTNEPTPAPDGDRPSDRINPTTAAPERQPKRPSWAISRRGNYWRKLDTGQTVTLFDSKMLVAGAGGRKRIFNNVTGQEDADKLLAALPDRALPPA